MKYVATQPVTVGVGSLVRLSPAQRSRMTGLVVDSKQHKGLHEVIAPVQFKVGEEFDTEDVVDASLSQSADKAKGADKAKEKAK